MMLDGSRHTPTTTRAGPQATVVPLPAEIDVTNSGQVHDTLARALRGGTAVLVADATATAFCDCAGVNALTYAHHQAATARAQLRLAASPAVRRILELTGTEHLLNAYPTVDAALNSKHHPASSNGDSNTR